MALRKSIVNRFKAVYVFIVMVFVFAIGRMLYTIIVEKDEWLAEFEKLQCSDRPIKPERGNMYDAEGNLITATIPYYKYDIIYYIWTLGLSILIRRRGKSCIVRVLTHCRCVCRVNLAINHRKSINVC